MSPKISNHTFKEKQSYYIRTRIIVEDMDNHSARSYRDITKDIKEAERVFANLNIKFIITEIAVSLPNQEWYAYAAQDAINYPDTLSIYYTFWRPPAIGFDQIVGMGSLPFGTPSLGVFVYGKSLKNSTLAHELGHYFGLLHTFQSGDSNDFVKDTFTKQEYADIFGEDKNYKEYQNLMNYHWEGIAPEITEGQENRIIYYLAKHRKNHLIEAENIREIPAIKIETIDVNEKDTKQNTEQEIK